MSKWDWSGLRRWVSLAGALGLLLFVGAVATRAPARRAGSAPVLLSRASGLASQSSAASPQLLADINVSGPTVSVSGPATSSSDFGLLKPVAPVVNSQPMPELERGESETAARATLGDSVLQAPSQPASPGAVMPGLLRNFPGLDFNDNGAGWPPDTNGDVGPNHYVQVVNTSIGIFNKTTGAPAVAAQTFDALFSGSGGVCDGNNRGDPVALYDAQADRWIVADFAWGPGSIIDTGPYYECIAASKTGDPTGAWWRYALRADDAGHPWLNDYPKLGVWPDGIYMSANMFDCSNNCAVSTYKGARVWAISPTQLYNGSVLTTVVFDTGASYFSLLPSHVHGDAPPPGTPNYFAANDLGVVALDVFKFHVNWTHTLSSTFTAPVQVAEASYTRPPESNGGDIPQLGGHLLDTLGDRLMMQNQYRNISGAESLWLSHAAGSPTGIRWYQVDVTGGSVNTTPVQQGTYAPADGLNRWMPSLAVDKFGNMAVGYSASGSAQFASIRYAGRLVSDTLGILGQTEAVLMPGGGAQTTPCGGSCANRWGDYSAMTVDPLDDCTFWYTSEYYAATGDNWQTRIGSFRFPVCGPAAPPIVPRLYLPLISDAQPAGSWTTITQENFEGGWPSLGWQAVDPGFGEYFWAERTCQAATGAGSAWAIGGGSLGSNLGCGTVYPNNMNSWMVFGPFSLADATAAEFNTKLWLNTESGFDFACLMASVNDTNFYTSNDGTCFSGSSGGAFVPTSLPLNDVFTLGSLIGQPQVWIAVIFTSDSSDAFLEGAHVDDLLVRKCVGGTCATSASASPGGAISAQTAVLHRP